MKNKENNSKQNLIIALLSILVLLVIIVITILIKPKEVEKQEETIVSTTETTTESTEVENDEISDMEDDKISEIITFYTSNEIKQSENSEDTLIDAINISYKDGWKFFFILDGKDPKKNFTHFATALVALNKVFKSFECNITLIDEINNPDREFHFYNVVIRDEKIINQVVPSEWEELDAEEIKNNLNTKESDRITNDIVQAIANVIKKCDEQGEIGFLDDIKDEYVPN